jgi:hypothetical protein
MRQEVACLMWEIFFCNQMNWNTRNSRGYSSHEDSFALNIFIMFSDAFRVGNLSKLYCLVVSSSAPFLAPIVLVPQYSRCWQGLVDGLLPSFPSLAAEG